MLKLTEVNGLIKKFITLLTIYPNRHVKEHLSVTGISLRDCPSYQGGSHVEIY